MSRELEERVRLLEATLHNLILYTQELLNHGHRPLRIVEANSGRQGQFDTNHHRLQKSLGSLIREMEWAQKKRETSSRSDFDKSDFNKADSDKSETVKTIVEGMLGTLNDTLVDARKHDRGNSAAGTRVRKAMQSTKNAAQDVRKQVQADKNLRW